jgi:hypothetical protein
MVYEKEQVKQANIIIKHLKNNKLTLTDNDLEVIAGAVREAYINGYDDGLNDGKEISDNPISG